MFVSVDFVNLLDFHNSVNSFLVVEDIAWNQPRSLPYPTENPFA